MFPEILDKVEEVMVKNPVTIDSGRLLIDAARLMEEKNIGSLIVVESGKCVGLVTERDFLRLAAAGIDMRVASIREWMTKPAVSCQPSTRVMEAYLLMRKHKVRHLPVLDKDKTPVGMVTMRDLLTVGELRL
jgi:CBS domain-containing protein